MKRLILVTGGARSGKSTLAEKKTGEIGNKIGYIATSIAFDDGMKDRIRKHRKSRPEEWITIERYKNFRELYTKEELHSIDTFLLDCMTLMVSNLLLESNIDFDSCSMEEVDRIEGEIFKEVDELLNIMEDKQLIIVTNEVGMGLVPSYKLGNIFRDMAGRVNQYLAHRADEVYFTVSGIPMKIK